MSYIISWGLHFYAAVSGKWESENAFLIIIFITFMESAANPKRKSRLNVLTSLTSVLQCMCICVSVSVCVGVSACVCMAKIMAALFDCLAALTSSLSHWARQSKVMHSITPIKADNGRCDSMGEWDSGAGMGKGMGLRTWHKGHTAQHVEHIMKGICV